MFVAAEARADGGAAPARKAERRMGWLHDWADRAGTAGLARDAGIRLAVATNFRNAGSLPSVWQRRSRCDALVAQA